MPPFPERFLNIIPFRQAGGSREISAAKSAYLSFSGCLVSLQKGKEAGQSAHVPPGMKLVDAAAELEDFSELAALVSCLDAVASVDTSVAHLAGALGIPTWILLPMQPDFRWMREREDSPLVSDGPAVPPADGSFVG